MSAAAQVEPRFVDAAGVRLRVLEDGAGTSVVVLHGFTGSAASMQPVAEGLRAHHRVLRLELVGHGESDAPRTVEAYRMDACAAQIVAACEALVDGPPHLVGYSMGGRAALAAAIARPTAFRSLLLIGATAGIEPPEARRERIASDEALAARIERDGLEAFVDDWMALPLFASQARLGSEALARARAERLSHQPHGLALSLRGMGGGAQTPLFERLGEISLPTLLVVGEADAKFRDIAAQLAAALPGGPRGGSARIGSCGSSRAAGSLCEAGVGFSGGGRREPVPIDA